LAGRLTATATRDTAWPRSPAVSPFLLVAFALQLLLTPPGQALEQRMAVPVWHELPSPEYVWPGGGAIYYSFDAGGTTVHLIVVDLQCKLWRLRPSVNAAGAPVSVSAENARASAATNGGYFNLSDGQSTSYVVIDGKTAADPSTNKALVDNPKLRPYIKDILDRTELRMLADKEGTISLSIAPHSAPVPAGLRLVHSIQGGPRLLPSLTSCEEAFVRREPDGTVTDGVGAGRRAARTAFGITPDGAYAMLLCAAGAKQDPESQGLTLAELADLMRSLGCSEALNLDGGSSTTMFVRSSRTARSSPAGPPPGRVVCGKNPETHVKSVLLLESTGAARQPGASTPAR